MELEEAMSTARAIRRYRDDPVSDEVLAECLEAATWAPSGSNRQGWRFVVLRSPEVRALLGPAYRRGWASMSGGYGLAEIDPKDNSPRARMGRTMNKFVERFEDVPVYVLFCIEGRARSVALTDGASIYPAVQNFLLAARARGLGGVITAWYQFCERALRDLLGIPDDWQIACLVPLGYPEGKHGSLRRRALNDVACIDRWDQPFPPT